MKKVKDKKNINTKVDKILSRDIEIEMKESYIDYAMSVIIGRALPDIRDGLKPVHRKILYAMKEMGLKHNTSYKKSARVVGDVLGKYHPHGDSAVYEAMVRMVQDFSLRYPIINGQGNFGSIDGDSAAAMRYTEVKMCSITDEMLIDLDKDTVDFISNYDGSLKEPSILPTRLPTLLINGSSGIAVGMATNIPPHNVSEICDALLGFIDFEENLSISQIMKYIKGPDFPTGAIIYGKKGITNYMETGRGSVKIRAKVKMETINNSKEIIIVTEIPYQVNKSNLIASIINLSKEKKIEGISGLRDESDRNGTRIVIEIKKETDANIVLNQLYKRTQMQTSFGVIMLALINNKPKIVNIKEMLFHHIEHRKSIIIRRTKYELQKAETRAHILEGLKVAIDNIDVVINIIKISKSEIDANKNLILKFHLTDLQTSAILEMKIRHLTNLKRQEINNEYMILIELIKNLNTILENPKEILSIIKSEIVEIKKKYGDRRRTQIKSSEINFNLEDLIQDEEVVITMSHSGYIKRIPISTYRAQNRGGHGVTAMSTKAEDFIENLFITNTHSYMLFFTTNGKLYWIKTYDIPIGSRISKGKAIMNFLNLKNKKEKITAAIPIKSFKHSDIEGKHLIMCTKNGIIKQVILKDFSKPRKNGVNAIKLKNGDVLTAVKIVDNNFSILIASKNGMAIRFNDKDLRVIKRSGIGVKGILLKDNDEVIGMEVLSAFDTFLSVSENGYGKRTMINKYRIQKRGGSGIINMQTTKRNGKIVSIRKTNGNEEIMLITKNGVMIRLKTNNIPIIGRITQGVRLVRLDVGDKVVAIANIHRN
ncbi:MAG: DNA gyrase subunit A [Endomicrobium sp.]|jgi:DNA gyrase subunit A|nr:DNA gyrase subunit A [Endomicrobium sp.]